MDIVVLVAIAIIGLPLFLGYWSAINESVPGEGGIPRRLLVILITVIVLGFLAWMLSGLPGGRDYGSDYRL